MTDTKSLIEKAYAAFNRRDIDGALALMTQHVSWPKASEGGKILGKENVRAYWTRQWGEFDGHVEPLEITEEGGGKVRVKVPLSRSKARISPRSFAANTVRPSALNVAASRHP